MKERIVEILTDLVPDFEEREDVKLLDDGILDSFDIVTLVMDLNDEFDVDIDVLDLTEENFNTIDGIEELIQSKLEE